MTSETSILLRSLMILHEDDPRAIRRRIIEILRGQISCDFCLYFQCVLRDETPHFTGVSCDGDSELREALLPYEDQPAVSTPWLPPNLDPRQIDTFILPQSHYGIEHLRNYEIHRQVFEPLNSSAQLRALLYDGPRFLGWFGLIRRGRGAYFRPQEVQLAQSIVDALKSSLLAAKLFERETLKDRVFAVLSAQGSIKHATAAFSRWLNPDRSSYLRGRIRDMDTGGERSSREFYAGTDVHVVCLDGADGVRYLAMVTDPEPLPLRPESYLTSRQREIVGYAIDDRSSREIADALELSFHTVNTHMKNIYRRLGINSRAELAAMFTHFDE